MRSDASIARFEPTSRISTLNAVFNAVSSHKNMDRDELRHLDEYVDATAISRLFGGAGGSTTRVEEGALSFRYDDVFVTMTHDGWVEVVDADAFHTRPAPYGLSADARAQQSPGPALEAAVSALAEAEEHIWTAASDTSNDELVDPLWAVVERLWTVQSSMAELMSQPSSTESLARRTDDRR